jgi:hypothetical protein
VAHLWQIGPGNEWTPRPLAGDAHWLDAVATIRRGSHPPHDWVILTDSPALRLNGAPVPIGIAVLRDRDEIRLPGQTLWFSTEQTASIEPLPPGATRGACPRCKRAIDPGSSAVRCPSCGLWHHESSEFACWTYNSTCAGCAQDTALDAGFRWSPEDL